MYASVEIKMWWYFGSAFVWGGGVAPVLNLDRRQGSVTNAKTPVRDGGGGVYSSPWGKKKCLSAIFCFVKKLVKIIQKKTFTVQILR